MKPYGTQACIALYAWAFTPVANLVGLYVPYPNQIRVLYGIAVGGLLCWATHGFCGARRELAMGLLWPIGFGTAFIVVSFYGLDFFNSVKFHVLYQPLLHAIPFLTWFVIARYFASRAILEALLVASVAVALHALALIALGSERERFLSDLSVPFGMAAGAITGVLFGSALANVIAIAMLSVTVWLCVRRTVLACGILALLIAFVGFKSYRANRIRIVLGVGLAAVVIGSIHLLPFTAQEQGSATTFASDPLRTFDSAVEESRDSDSAFAPGAAGDRFLDKSQATVGRLFEADQTRRSISRLSKELLFQFFPYGIGYMSFMKEAAPHINYTTFTASGEQLSGPSLHNTYMHFALEGGLLIVIIVFAASVVYVRAMLQLLGNGNHEVFLALLTWSVMGALYGWFHQIYMTDYLFGLFGFALGAAGSKQTALARRNMDAPELGRSFRRPSEVNSC